LYTIDIKSSNICLNHGNTLSIGFWLAKKDAGFVITPGKDKVYAVIRDGTGTVIFSKTYDVVEVPQVSGSRYKWTFAMSFADSEKILPGQYTWDYTYFQNATVDTGGKPTGGAFVTTPSAVRRFTVMKVASDTSEHAGAINWSI